MATSAEAPPPLPQPLAAYLDFVRRHHRLGFTDFSTVLPAREDEPVLRTIATEVIPEIRAGLLLD